ncbi:MAG: ribosomal protein S18-alanine N-acetyltransferase [Thermodesulfobacteriota bacterium]
MFSDQDILPGRKLRPMTAEDLGDVLDIERVSFPNPWSREMFVQELRNPVSRRYVLRLPEDGGEVLAAYIIFWVVHGEAHILNIAVDPRFRGKGVAGRVLAEALDMMRAELVFEVFLEVRRSNMPARALYRRFGFKEVYERKGYYGDEDAIVMSLNL